MCRKAITAIQKRQCNLPTGGSSGGGIEKWLDSRCIMKMHTNNWIWVYEKGNLKKNLKFFLFVYLFLETGFLCVTVLVVLELSL